MKDICGSITINFTGKTSKRRLLEEFSDELFVEGILRIRNAQGEEVELEVHDFEYGVVEQFDEDGEILDDDTMGEEAV